MPKYIPVVCAFVYCTAGTANESKDTKNWFITLGVNAYSNNNIHYNIADTVRGHTSIHDDNCGYNLSVGYDWEWIAAEMALNRVRLDDADAIAITGRVTMPVFPMENMPYVGFEYGAVGVRYSNDEYDISTHDKAMTFGFLAGLRYDITQSWFISAFYQYNVFDIHVDIYDASIKLNIHRQNLSLALGWRF